MKQNLKEFFLVFFSTFLTAFLTYHLGYFNALQDEHNNPYLCRVKNPKYAIYEGYDELYAIEGKLKKGEGHVIIEIKKDNQTKIIDKTAFSKPEDFEWYIKVRFFDFNNDKRADLVLPCGFKIKGLVLGC